MKASSSFSDEQFSLWKTVLVRNFMSSEESAEEDDGVGDKQHILVVKPLPWRAPKVSRFFKRLDKRAEKAKSKQSKQQTLPRFETEEPSDRPKPLEYSDDFFGFSAT